MCLLKPLRVEHAAHTSFTPPLKPVHNILLKYEKHFPKMLRDVEMAAVPKTTQTRYMHGWQCAGNTEDYTSNPSLHLFFFFIFVIHFQ